MLTVSADGGLSYDPAGAFEHLFDGEHAVDTFEITVSDPGGLTASADVAVTVTGFDNPPPDGLADALGLALCGTPDQAEVTVTSAWPTDVALDVRLVDPETDALLDTRAVTIPADDALTLTFDTVDEATSFRVDLAYNRTHVVATDGSGDAPSCFLPGLSLTATCSTYQTGRFVVTNDNDEPVTFGFGTRDGLETHTVAPDAALDLTLPYGERAELHLGGRRALTRDAPQGPVCDDFADHIRFETAYANSENAYIRVYNDSDEDIAVGLQYWNGTRSVPARRSVLWTLPWESRYLFTLRGVPFEYYWLESGPYEYLVTAETLCVSPEMAAVQVHSQHPADLTIRILSKEYSVLKSEDETVDAGTISTILFDMHGFTTDQGFVLYIIDDGAHRGPDIPGTDVPCY